VNVKAVFPLHVVREHPGTDESGEQSN
jgi:hypothetical protein